MSSEAKKVGEMVSSEAKKVGEMIGTVLDDALRFFNFKFQFQFLLGSDKFSNFELVLLVPMVQYYELP